MSTTPVTPLVPIPAPLESFLVPLRASLAPAPLAPRAPRSPADLHHPHTGQLHSSQAITEGFKTPITTYHLPPHTQVLLECSRGSANGVDGPSGAATAGSSSRPPGEVLAPELLSLIRKQVLAVNELSRHFWACIPANTEAKMDKVRGKVGHYTVCRALTRAHRTPTSEEQAGLAKACLQNV